MSFGIAIGDIIAVAKLAKSLYTDFYQVVRHAPQEFRLLHAEIQTLSGSMSILESEANNPQSVLVLAGDDRARLVNEIVSRILGTLGELKEMAGKYGILGMEASKRKQLLARVSWTLKGASAIHGLRSKVFTVLDFTTSILRLTSGVDSV
jgi:hypothetical protein